MCRPARPHASRRLLRRHDGDPNVPDNQLLEISKLLGDTAEGFTGSEIGRLLHAIARIIGYAQADVAPEWLFEAPINGVRRLIERVGGSIGDFDLIEINEAFAAQVLADGNELGFDWDRVNVNGGSIAPWKPSPAV